MSSRSLRAALAVAVIGLGTAIPFSQPQPVAAASCIRFSATQFEGPGNDNYQLNGEWVRIKNHCASRRSIGGWKIHDYKRIHTYTFPSGAAIGPGRTITLYSGRGLNTSSRRYWGRTYGAVWNNTPPEYAYLRSASGLIVAKRTEY